jgi:hypothetical protein
MTQITSIATTTVAPSQTWTNFNGVNSSSSKSINGLKLSLSLDSTTYKPGQDVLITIDEYNTLKIENNVPQSEEWAFDFLTLGGCGTMGSFFGIAVFQGSLTYDDISKGVPLLFWNYSLAIPCPTEIPPPKSAAFKPLSHAFWEMHLNGYWKGRPMATFTNFTPGVYTIIAGDEWGATVVCHFTVTP